MSSSFSIDPALAVLLAAVLGLAVGSWLTVVVHRLPRIMEYDWDSQAREPCQGDLQSEPHGNAAAADPLVPPPPPRPSLLRPASHCPACAAPLRGWHRVPVLGCLLLRGRCASCGAAIGWRYPLIEITTALLFAACVWRLGPTVAAACAMVFTAALVALAWIDLETGLLPDVITLPLLWAGLLVNTAHVFTGPASAIVGAASGYVFLWLLFHAFRLATGREGMGHGDFKLLAALGAWLGVAALPWILIMASVCGVVVGLALIFTRRVARGQPQPFGPYLAAAGIVGLLAVGMQPAWIFQPFF
jgi:leader peptidase (prepilin peptidase)/N-methyltransferase